MKNMPLIFLGVFFTLMLSWSGIILSSHFTLGQLGQTTQQLERNPDTGAMEIVAGETLYPLQMSGEAVRGKQVYIEMGCLYCHSQQVRRKGFGADFERGWGDRQTVARDYIQQDRVLLGTMRTGPDLMTVGQRIPDVNWHMIHLYNPQTTSEGSIMPPFPFLFQERPIGVQGLSADALKLSGTFAPRKGYEVVPTQRAKDLVAYLMSLRLDYELPEAKFSE
jgi:cytochrome c oxidase cbb3-type subunit 2